MKDKRFEIRISEEEIKDIKRAAMILEISPSVYIRETMINRNKRVKPKQSK